MMRGTTVLAVLALLVVTCQMKTLLVKTKSKGGDDYSLQHNSGRVGGNMNQGGRSGKRQSNSGIVGGGMCQGGGFGSKQSNLGRVGGNMNQGGGFGKSQTNHGTVGGSMNQDYNTQINTGSVGGGMHQGGGFGNNLQGNAGRVGGSMVQGGGFGRKQSNHGGVGGSMVQGGGFGNSQTNSGNVGGNMVQDYSAEVSCKQLKARMEKLCSEEKKVKPVCYGIVKRFHKKKCYDKKAEDYQIPFPTERCSGVVCNSRDYQTTAFRHCCQDN